MYDDGDDDDDAHWILASLSHWMIRKTQVKGGGMFVLFLCVFLDVSMNSILSSDAAEGWLHVYLYKNSIIFCLFSLRRSRTETASSHGCSASEFVCQHVSLCDRVKHVCSPACSKYGQKKNPSTTREYLPRVECVMCYVGPHSDPQQKSRLIVSHVGSKEHCVY